MQLFMALAAEYWAYVLSYAQKAWFMKFINNLGYLWWGTLVDEVEKKHLQCLIDIWLLIGARSLEEKKTIIGKLQNLQDL